MCVHVCYLLSQPESTAKLLSITVARPHLHPCVNDLKKKIIAYGSVKKKPDNKKALKI